MITYIHNEEKQIGDETYIWFIGNCLSTDAKPTELVYTTSKLFEVDTLRSFIFDGSAWLQVSSGGGGSDILLVNMTYDEIDDTPHAILDKTFLEIYSSDLTVVKSSMEDPIMDSGAVSWIIPDGISHDGRTGRYSLTVGSLLFSGYANDFPEYSGGK